MWKCFTNYLIDNILLKIFILFFVITIISNVYICIKSNSDIPKYFVAINQSSGCVIKSFRNGPIYTSYILTCAHVIKDEKILLCSFPTLVKDEIKYLILCIAKPIEVNELLDFAILEVETLEKPQVLKTDIKKVKLYDNIKAVGRPNGVSLWMSRGVISSFRLNRFCYDGVGFFGSSGGPCIKHNKLVGIINGIDGSAFFGIIENMVTALPINYIYNAMGAKKFYKYFQR